MLTMSVSIRGIRWVFCCLVNISRHVLIVSQADVYSNGRSEEVIGKALKQYNIPRNRVVILSKCYFGVEEGGEQPQIAAVSTNDGPMVNRVGLSRKHIIDAVDDSVRRLGTYIDVLQIHRLDRATPREEIMRALNDVVESGKVRYIGASSVSSKIPIPIAGSCC